MNQGYQSVVNTTVPWNESFPAVVPLWRVCFLIWYQEQDRPPRRGERLAAQVPSKNGLRCNKSL
jgi:hypothetical protein